jgi:hypothetical protein
MKRKWFRVPDSILRAEMSNDALASLVRLQAHMHGRWARDEEVGSPSTVVIGPRLAMLITGKRRADSAVRALLRLPAEAGLGTASARLVRTSPTNSGSIVTDNCPTSDSLVIDYENISVVFDWPKCASFQRWLPQTGEENAPSETKTETETKEERPGGRTRVRPVSAEPPEAEPKKAAREGRFAPPNVAGLDVETLPLQTAEALLRVQPRGGQETPETLAAWFAWVAPQMHLRQIKNLPSAARKWWPRLRREDVERANEWLQMQRVEASRRRAAPPPPARADDDDFELTELFAGEPTQ